jgi:hypothetical protein
MQTLLTNLRQNYNTQIPFTVAFTFLNAVEGLLRRS